MEDQRFRTLSSAEREKSYKIEKVVNYRNAAVFCSALSVVFQVSYLNAISPVLLSYMSLQDTVFKTVITLPAFVVALSFLANVFEDFEVRLDAGDGYRGSDAERNIRGFWFITISLIAIISAYCLYKVFITDESLSDQMRWIKAAGVLLGWSSFAWILSHYLWRLAVVRHDAERRGVITGRNLINLAIFSLTAAFVSGQIGGYIKRGAACAVTVDGAVHEMRFLASVNGVTAFKQADGMEIVNSSKIDKMVCQD